MEVSMCTRDEVLTFDGPVLFPSVPVTYVITMEGSSRYEVLMRELRTYRPTRKVVIVHHKPHSECARPKWVTKPSLDLWRNNIMIAQRDPSSPVLILEDDVRFMSRVRDYAAHIDALVAQEKCEVYNLGVISCINVPSFGRDMTVWLGGSAQAVLYTARGRERFVHLYGDDPSFKASGVRHFCEIFGLAWLHDLEISSVFHMLASTKPCAVQELPKTENRKEWCNAFTRIAIHLTGAEKDGSLLFEISNFIGRYFGGVFPFTLVALVALVTLVSPNHPCIDAVN